MINFEEELKKFYPSLEVEQIEDNIHNKNLTDMVDLMEEMGIIEGLPESNQLSLFDFT